MFSRRIQLRSIFACLGLAVAPAVQAQWAVVDIPATVQLIQEVLTARQQLVTLKSQLQQAQQALQSMSGSRGMQQLLGTVNRNYLPTNWNQVSALAQGSGGAYGSLSVNIQSIAGSNAVLSPRQLAALAPAGQQQILAQRQWSATRLAISQSALATASSRFSALQTLINAMSSATDQKGILDLQARINAELGMLENEQAKLQALSQAFDAHEAVLRQQQREQAIAAQGSFAGRFQPVP
ncbi:MAG: type IV secretion system protein [Steroidobacteraceae bacterium]|jgi:type IV secretion system protein VirB5